MTIELIVDSPTASWILRRVYEDGLLANVCIGFPYDEAGRKVCAVRLDYASDDDLEISRLVALASERASHFSMKPSPLQGRGVKNDSL